VADPAPQWNDAPTGPPPVPPAPPAPPLGTAPSWTPGSPGEARGGRSVPRWLIVVVLVLVVVVVGLGLATGVIKVWTTTTQTSLGPPPAASLPPVGVAADGHFQGSGIDFRYPSRWSTITDPTWRSTSSAVRLSILGLQAPNEAVVEEFRLNQPVRSRADVRAAARSVDANLRSIVRAGGGRIDAGPIRATVGGVPAIEYRISGLPDGSAVRQRLIFTFKGAYEFQIACAGSPADWAPIAAGCDQIVRTFRFS
jgi:hypothetical protein